MIRIYTAPSYASCRKVKSWLNENQLPYVEKIIFSKEWSMFFNIPKIKIIDNLFIVSCLLLKHFDKKELKKERNKKSGLGKCFFPLLLCSLLCVVFSFNRLTLYN